MVEHLCNDHISLKLKEMSPVQYRTHSLAILYLFFSNLGVHFIHSGPFFDPHYFGGHLDHQIVFHKSQSKEVYNCACQYLQNRSDD